MNHTALNLCLWENSLNCIFKSGKTIYAEKQNILHTPVFQVMSIPSQNLLVSFAPTVILRISL